MDNPWSWRFFPEQWSRFRDGVPEEERTGSLVEPYHRLLMNLDPTIHEKARTGATGNGARSVLTTRLILATSDPLSAWRLRSSSLTIGVTTPGSKMAFSCEKRTAFQVFPAF